MLISTLYVGFGKIEVLGDEISDGGGRLGRGVPVHHVVRFGKIDALWS